MRCEIHMCNSNCSAIIAFLALLHFNLYPRPRRLELCHEQGQFFPVKATVSDPNEHERQQSSKDNERND